MIRTIIAKVVLNQRSILDLYRLDIAKYAEGSDKAKIKAIFDSIPAQLNEKNRRFKLNSINASADISGTRTVLIGLRMQEWHCLAIM